MSTIVIQKSSLLFSSLEIIRAFREGSFSVSAFILHLSSRRISPGHIWFDFLSAGHTFYCFTLVTPLHITPAPLFTFFLEFRPTTWRQKSQVSVFGSNILFFVVLIVPASSYEYNGPKSHSSKKLRKWALIHFCGSCFVQHILALHVQARRTVHVQAQGTTQGTAQGTAQDSSSHPVVT
jgi:hypothetical protein